MGRLVAGTSTEPCISCAPDWVDNEQPFRFCDRCSKESGHKQHPLILDRCVRCMCKLRIAQNVGCWMITKTVVVLDQFMLIGMGLVVVCKPPELFNNGEVKILRPRQSTLTVTASLVKTVPASWSEYLSLNLPGLTKEDIPIGSRIRQ